MRKFIAAVTAAVAALAVSALPASAGAKEDGTIVDKVIEISGASGFDENNGDFDILRDAVVATGLGELLAGNRQLTVFAPTDQAFLDLTEADDEQTAFNAVAALGTQKVRQILKYHVTPGRIGAAQVVKAKQIETLYKGAKIKKERGSTELQDKTGRTVEVVAPNAAKVENGVVHVIDGVLLPFQP